MRNTTAVEKPASPIVAVNGLCISAKSLGSGGYASVFRGRLGGRPVAVKQFRFHDDQEVFEREVRAMKQLATLSSPYLMTMLASYPVDNALPAIILPLMQMNLTTFIDTHRRQGEPLRTDLRLSIASGLASALACMHQLKPEAMVHGDIKSDNVLFAKDSSVPVLADFGMSTTLSDIEPGYKGTLEWAAPELLTNVDCVMLTCATDVYSLGMIFLMMLTLQKPRSNFASFVSKLKAARQGWHRPIPDNAGPAYAQMIQQCLCKSPAGRPNAAKIKASLELLDQAEERLEPVDVKALTMKV